MLPHGQVNCRLCGRQVDANVASMRDGICRAPACDAERNRLAATTIMERDWMQYRQATAHRLDRAADQIAAVSDRTGIAMEELKIQMLPRQIRKSAPRSNRIFGRSSISRLLKSQSQHVHQDVSLMMNRNLSSQPRPVQRAKGIVVILAVNTMRS